MNNEYKAQAEAVGIAPPKNIAALDKARKSRLNALRLSEEAKPRDYDRMMRGNRSVCG